MNRLDWDDLRYALAVAEGRSAGAAAKALGVTHSTVLRRLDAMEARLGVELFVRRRERYVPTECGELLVEQARRVADGVVEAERRLLGRDLMLSGSVRLATSLVLLHDLIPEALAAFARAHPAIEVQAIELPELADLSRREADLALRMATQVPEHLVGRRLGDARFRVYAQRGAAHLPQTPQPLGELLTRHDWVSFDQDRFSHQYDQWLNQHVPPERVRLRVDLFNALSAMLRTGLGIGLLPTFAGDRDDRLLAVSAEIDELQTPVWLLTHPDLRNTARVRAFWQQVGDAASARLASSPAALSGDHAAESPRQAP